MRSFVVVILSLAVAGAALAQVPAPPGPGQPPKPKLETTPKPGVAEVKPVEERLFLVYALEDLYRDTWPADAPSPRVASSSEARRLRANQRKLADQLRYHMTARKFDPELIDLFDRYRKLLDTAEDLAKQLGDREDVYAAPLVKLTAAYVKEEELRQLKANAEVTNTAVEAGTRVGGRLFADPIDMAIGGLFAGFGKSMALQMELKPEREKARQQLSEDIKAHHAKYGPSLSADVAELGQKFFLKFDATRQDELTHAGKVVAGLAGKYQWSAEECELDPARPASKWTKEARPRDPFRAKQAAQALPPPKDREGADRCVAAAKECLAVVNLVPPAQAKSTSEVYRFYRALFCGQAGQQANAAAAEQIGAAGFKVANAKAPPAAATAVAAWERYSTYESDTKDGRGVVLHYRLLACVYAGKLPQAYGFAKKASGVTQNLNPEFWYDAARVCSLSGDVPNALFCLRRAVGLGLKKMDEARATPDLDTLRLKDPVGFNAVTAGR